MIRTVNLHKQYGEFVAVNQLNLNIRPGEIYGFLGPNGAGKTSTIMMLLGISRPSSGEIYLFGERFTQKRLDLRKRIGVVPEKHPQGVWQWMTAVEYLELFADLFQVRGAKARIDVLLERVGLEGARNKRFRHFSRGMLQKLSIIRALLPDPDILFLDEPISGLDPLGVKQVRDLIVAENRVGRTIFISSHLLSEMEKICNRVAIMFRGRLMAEDTMTALMSRMVREREVRIDLERVPKDLGASMMRELSFVHDVEVEGDTLTVKIPNHGDFRHEISAFLISAGLLPLGIKEHSPSLEEAFVTITQENIEMFTSPEAKS